MPAAVFVESEVVAAAVLAAAVSDSRSQEFVATDVVA